MVGNLFTVYKGLDEKREQFYKKMSLPFTVVCSHVVEGCVLLKCDRDITTLMTDSEKVSLEIKWLD